MGFKSPLDTPTRYNEMAEDYNDYNSFKVNPENTRTMIVLIFKLAGPIFEHFRVKALSKIVTVYSSGPCIGEGASLYTAMYDIIIFNMRMVLASSP